MSLAGMRHTEEPWNIMDVGTGLLMLWDFQLRICPYRWWLFT